MEDELIISDKVHFGKIVGFFSPPKIFFFPLFDRRAKNRPS